MVMFDLPVVSREDRSIANKFRHNLEKEGFSMCQFSVYARFCGPRERTERIYRLIESFLPDKGKVNLIMFTDKQFGQIVQIVNRKKKKSKENPDQYLIFSDEELDLSEHD